MIIEVAKVCKVKRRNGLGKIYYKCVWIWNSDLIRIDKEKGFEWRR